MSTDQTASRLYGSTTPAPEPTPVAAPSIEQALADRMYSQPPAPDARSDVPEAVKALRAADPTRRMFSTAKAWAGELPDGALDGIDSAEAREVLVDLGAELSDVRELRSLSNVDGDAAEWRAEAEKLIVERNFSAADLDAARRLVQRDPRVAAFLDSSGLGNHPKVVARAVEMARSALANGSLPHTKNATPTKEPK